MPKLIVLSSDDEFMMMDWSNIWYDSLTGEKHLLISPNSEHSLSTNIYGELSAFCSFARSIISGHESRPHFNFTYDGQTGEIKVKVSDEHKVSKVLLRHAETL